MKSKQATFRLKELAVNGGKIEIERDEVKSAEHKALIIGAFHCVARGAGQLAARIMAAMQDGIQRKEIVEWGISAGYSESWVRSQVSACFVKAGKKNENIKGKAYDQRAIDLQAEIVHRFGADGIKLLLSAYRYAKSQEKAATVQVAKAA